METPASKLTSHSPAALRALVCTRRIRCLHKCAPGHTHGCTGAQSRLHKCMWRNPWTHVGLDAVHTQLCTRLQSHPRTTTRNHAPATRACAVTHTRIRDACESMHTATPVHAPTGTCCLALIKTRAENIHTELLLMPSAAPS